MTATNFTEIFGSEIKVGFQPREPNNQYTGCPGAHGLTGIMMGSRGRPVIVTGTLRRYGATYLIARTAMVELIRYIELIQFYAERNYTYGNEVYYNTVLEKFQLTDSDGKTFKYSMECYCTVQFVAYFRELL